MTVAEFIAKWRHVELKERSAAQEHFLDLCHLLGHPTPAEADPTGETFCFEKGIAKHGGGEGFADVWKKGFFGWEYKGRHKDLNAAYNQLLLYRDSLANPPLLVLCDLDRIIVHTNFTNTVSSRHEIALAQLGEPRNIEILRAVFLDPEKLRPGQTSESVTQIAAQQFAGIAESMRNRGLDSAAVAHFLDRVVFCLFAEDIGLLPTHLFTRIADSAAAEPARFATLIGQLFTAMSKGGDFGLEKIRHFNGSLFDGASVPDLTVQEAAKIVGTARLDWSAVDPSIFGTLFERGLDPAKRSQLGAHFTGKEDIRILVDAVVMTPLRREWDETRQTVINLMATGKKSGMGVPPMSPQHGRDAHATLTPAQDRKARMESESILHQFLDRLRGVRVLDPACGSGNFLYVALARLKDLEKEAAVIFPSENGLNTFLPGVGPWQLHGIEINAYAHDLAQMTVWIGWLQWIHANGFGFPADPVLRSLSDNIRHMDSIVSETGEPEWPAVDFIVGNPPFLGDKLMRRELGDAYVDRVRALYDGRIPGQSDLCCYWFEKARTHIAEGKCRRAGLLATQGIRGGANREVLKRIKDSGGIFWAESDRDWFLDGANVHVSIVGFDDGTETTRMLDGKAVATINADLSSAADTTQAARLPANASIGFLGSCKGGPFDVSDFEALEMLACNGNPHMRPNSDVIRPVANSEDLLKTRKIRWIVDSANLTSEELCLYERPGGIVTTRVKPLRDTNRDKWLHDNWWRPQRMRPEMRAAIAGLPRFIITPTTAKHRIFIWLENPVLPDHQLIVFAHSDDCFFGLLHSRLHEVWSLAQGTQLREKESGFRYTPTTCFETFPLPVLTEGQSQAIAADAKELNALRENWLNPPEWTRTDVMEFSGTVGGPWDRHIDPATVIDRGAFKVGTVRYPRLVALDTECAARLKDRTLTKLYNVRPAWLATCHAKLDAAVAAAYGWPADLPDDAILERLLALNLERSKALWS